MRYYLDMDGEQLVDSKGELSSIDFRDKVDFYELCEHLNQKEIETLEYKKELNNLKHKIKKLSESI